MLNKKTDLRLNKILLIVGMLLFFISPTVMAWPTGYCPKTPGPVLKTMCKRGFIGDGAPLDLDYTQSLIYEFALVSTKNSPSLKESQRQWAKKRAVCKDVACVTESTRHRMHELEDIIDGHPNKSQSSENKNLNGLWSGGDSAARAIYGNLLITDNTITWGHNESTAKVYCKTNYSVEKEFPGTTFEDSRGLIYTINEKSEFKTYKIKLKQKVCTNSINYLRFTLPSSPKNYADIIEYKQNNQISGYLSFHKYQY